MWKGGPQIRKKQKMRKISKNKERNKTTGAKSGGASRRTRGKMRRTWDRSQMTRRKEPLMVRTPSHGCRVRLQVLPNVNINYGRTGLHDWQQTATSNGPHILAYPTAALLNPISGQGCNQGQCTQWCCHIFCKYLTSIPKPKILCAGHQGSSCFPLSSKFQRCDCHAC